MVRSGSNDAVDAHKSLLRVLPGARLQVETAQCREAEEAHHLKVVARCACIQRGISAFESDLVQSRTHKSERDLDCRMRCQSTQALSSQAAVHPQAPPCRTWHGSAS